MLYLFVLLFLVSAQDMLATKYMCNRESPCGCSRRIRNRVFGGENASRHAWTWATSLRNKNKHFCGGSILNERFVITAAHCFSNIDYSPSNITVCAGTNQLSSSCRQLREIRNVTKHPSFKTTTFENDIALIEVKVPFNFNDPLIARICLPDTNRMNKYPEPDTDVTAISWGITETNEQPDMLQQVTAKVVDEFTDDCDSILRNNSVQLCAGAFGKDTCSGDGGGPLMVFTESKRWELIGITSYGASDECETEDSSVYTRVTAFLTWIQQSINKASSQSLSHTSNLPQFNGNQYQGELKDGKMHGTGTMTYANGEKYTGNWVQGKKSGVGVYTWPNGDRYEGKFKDDKKHGTGKMIYASGKIKYGKWSNDVFVSRMLSTE